MPELLNHPAVQAGLAPLVVSLVVAILLMRTRFAWVAILAGYATMVAMTTGFSFSPLSASRKLLLLVLLAPVAGLILDLAWPSSKRVAELATGAVALLAPWVFVSVLAQRDAGAAIAIGTGLAAFVAALVWLMLQLRHDGPATGAAGLGLGLATGIGALLSASSGYFLSGVAVAAASGSLLLLQLVAGRNFRAGYTGAMSIGVACALFAAATLLLAQLPWYALPLLLLVPAMVLLFPAGGMSARLRVVIVSLVALAAAVAPLLAAWFATRGGLIA